MKGIYDVFELPVGEVKSIGVAKLKVIEYSRKSNPIGFMRDAMAGMAISDGKYVQLIVDGTLMMSDTDMEKNSNRTFVHKANGRVLIAGLGVGLIIKNILPKIEDGSITEVVIIEKYQDVIDLVSPYYKNEKIKYVCADILDYKPAKEEKYDVIYFDIWPTICEDNLDEINLLHNRFKSKLNRINPNCWMNSWMKEFLQKEKRCYRYTY